MKSELRIALFSGNYNYQADGANKALNRLVAYLERQGIEVLVFSPTTDTPAFEPEGTLVSVPSIPIPGRGEYRIGFGLSHKLKRQISAFNPTLIHLSAPDLLGHSALKFAEMRGLPVVASYHTRFDAYFQYYKLGWIAPYCRKKMAKFYNRCTHVYAPGKSIGKILQDQHIVGNNLRVWSRGIDRELFNPNKRDIEWRRSLGIRDNDIVLCFVGRLVREKGLTKYIELICALNKRGLPVKALIVGDGPECKTIRALLPDAIMTGHLTQESLSRAYASSDLFINPSLTETFGNVTLEAMSSGVPTICLKATGSCDLVRHGNTGWLIDGSNNPHWITKTAGLCSNAPLRKRMGAAARKITTDYQWDSIMQALLDQYFEVVEQIRPSQMALAS